MNGRGFPEVSIPYGDKQTMAMRITCAHCGGVAYFPFMTGPNRKPPRMAAQHFEKKGWAVGNSPKKDFCPVHASPAKRKGASIMAEPVRTVVAEKPREMTREERRIINDKLDEVYGKDAYRAPWTDAAVAKDLGVLRDWVAQVREQFFGAAGSNPLFEELLAETARIEVLFSDYSKAAVAAAAAAKRVAEAFAALDKEMEAYRHLARRVEREVGR